MFKSLKKIIRLAYLFCGLLIISYALFANSTNRPAQPTATLIPLNGAVSPATADFVIRGLQEAAQQSRVAILQIDTPGGLSKSMRKIIQAILNSPIPVISYVAPSGARAASAGTYILYASHVAVMAPGTNLGAATPVAIGGGTPRKPNDKKAKQTSKPSASQQKALNDARAYIRGLAQLRKRNVEWAERAVTKAASLSAKEAVTKNVINFMANNPQQALQKANGLSVLVQGRVVQLNTKNLSIMPLTPDWRTRFLTVLTDPSIAYILLMVGIYGLFFEFLNPGFIVPGVLGGISALLALYALNLMPVNYIGLGLLVLGLGLIIAEFFVGGIGILGIGGAISFIFGSILLFNGGSSAYPVPIYTILGISIVMLLAMVLLLTLVARSRHRKVVSGREGLVGQVGIIKTIAGKNWVIVGGERWQYQLTQQSTSANVGDKVKIEKLDGLTLIVSKQER